MITHLTDPDSLDADDVTVDGDAYRHLFRARRLAVGDRIRVVDGAGRARWGTVERVEPATAVVTLAGAAPANEPAYALQLLVATLRPERASWLVEKGTELGVMAIRFLETARAPRRYGAGRIERLERVARAALIQCHRARLPAISGVHPWDELEGLLQGQADRFVLDPEAPPEPLRVPTGSLTGTVLVGPEGGWDGGEQKTLARLATPIGLGPRVLRVETAALVAAARLLSP